jgi:AraC-like DNA-binding protein
MQAEPTEKGGALWQPQGPHGVLLLRANYDHQRFARHTHEEYVVGVNVRGAHSFYCDGREHFIPCGDIALVNPGEVHTGQVVGQEGWRYRSFFVSEALVREISEDTGENEALPSFAQHGVHDPELSNALVRAHMALEGNSDASALERDSRLIEALAALFSRYAFKRPTHRSSFPVASLQHAREVIEAGYQKELRLDDLARDAEMGRFQFLRAFRKTYGTPPYEYLMLCRVAAARSLIASGMPLSRVALATGFADQSHLTRQFKRRVGFTPGQYARALSA